MKHIKYDDYNVKLSKSALRLYFNDLLIDIETKETSTQHYTVAENHKYKQGRIKGGLGLGHRWLIIADFLYW